MSFLVFQSPSWNAGHCMRQLRCVWGLTVTFVLGKVTSMWWVRILLTAVNTNSCFCCCREGDEFKHLSWHKLDWWHVRLAFRSLKGQEHILSTVSCYAGWTRAIVCFCDWEGGHQLFQQLEVSEEISQLLEHSNPGTLKATLWKTRRHSLNSASPDLYRSAVWSAVLLFKWGQWQLVRPCHFHSIDLIQPCDF